MHREHSNDDGTAGPGLSTGIGRSTDYPPSPLNNGYEVPRFRPWVAGLRAALLTTAALTMAMMNPAIAQEPTQGLGTHSASLSSAGETGGQPLGILISVDPQGHVSQSRPHDGGLSDGPASGANRSVSEPAQAALVAETDDEQPFVRRRGMVRLNPEVILTTDDRGWQRSTAAPGQMLRMRLFPDRSIDLRIQRDLSPPANGVAAFGHWGDNPDAEVSITITPEAYIINVEHPEKALRYRIVGNTFSGHGTVTEIDLTRFPRMTLLPPLTPTDTP